MRDDTLLVGDMAGGGDAGAEKDGGSGREGDDAVNQWDE
jgi:hypothetical protein